MVWMLSQYLHHGCTAPCGLPDLNQLDLEMQFYTGFN
jgi:hypothetical protein